MKRVLAVAALAILGCGGMLPSQRAKERMYQVEIAKLEAENRALELEIEMLKEENRRILAGSSPPAIPRAAGTSPRCTQIGGRYELSRGAFDSLNEISSEGRLVPSFQDGKAQGFKIYAIRPDSIYASCGFQNGDVISLVNGMQIDSPEKALNAYAKTKDADALLVEGTRAGARFQIDIGLVD